MAATIMWRSNDNLLNIISLDVLTDHVAMAVLNGVNISTIIKILIYIFFSFPENIVKAEVSYVSLWEVLVTRPLQLLLNEYILHSDK